MRVWIDLANSPHPLIFEPVARRLEDRGHEVRLTVRDHAQTRALAHERWPGAEVLGGESPAGRGPKGRAIFDRVRLLRRWGREHRPDLALSHNSYAQIVAARSIGVPVVTAMDYEHQRVNHIAFRLAKFVVAPEAFPVAIARRQGARPPKLVRHPGLKESLYLGEFEPDSSVLAELGVEAEAEAGELVVARTPPSRALYHRLDNPLFEECLKALDRAGARTVVLPRHPEQVTAIEGMNLDNSVVAESAIDSRSLLWHARLFLGAGGTMTREAALLGVTTVSVFAGEVPAVDRWLERRGLITRIEGPGQLPLQAAETTRRTPQELDREAGPILDRYLMAVETAAPSKP
jgi:predicted glycosyltransferase